MRKYPFTLRFEPDDLEDTFLADYHDRYTPQTRWAALLACLLYAACGLLDRWFVGDAAPVFLGIRVGVCGLLLAFFGFTYTRYYRRRMQAALATGMFAAGLGVVLMVLQVRDVAGYYYHDHLMLVIVFGATLARLRFMGAAAVVWTLVAAYEAAVVAFKDIPPLMLANTSLALITTAVAGSAAAYWLERHAREAFWHARVLDDQRRDNARLVRTQARFFANISHELRTPLTLILGPVDNLRSGQRGEVSPEQRRLLDLVHRNASRLLRFLNQLLDLSRLDAGSMELQTREEDMGTYVAGIVAAFDSYAEHRQVSLHVDVPEEPVRLAFDAARLDQVLYNLLSNAIKFTGAGGKVLVSVAATEASVEIMVRDTGAGIAPEALPYLFDRFYQVDAALEAGREGSGLGLALARELVALHGGTLRAESRVGFGSTFTVSLPRRLEPGEAVQGAARPGRSVHTAVREAIKDLRAADGQALVASSASEAMPEGPALLIVEDNADFRAYLRACLAVHYRLLEAETGEQGLALAQEHRPALVLTDVRMPGAGGEALCRALKADPDLGHVPVVLLTARAEEDHRVSGLAAGADAYLSKPFYEAELLALIEGLLEQRQRLRERFSKEVVLRPSDIVVPSEEAAFLDRLCAMVEAQMEDPDFGVERLADEVGLSRRQLQRRLKAATGLTASDFVRRLRLERAAQLLAQRTGTVAEVAYAVGYRDPLHFSKVFRQMHGMAPSAYGRENGTSYPD